jgi:peptidoglycan hydrolase-like protein with peptidoglycan-binding domain
MRGALFLALVVLSAAPAAAQPCRTVFAPGLEAASVRDIQLRLEEHGFDPGPIDSQLGRRTCAAVRAYQKAAGLRIDGVLDQKLQNHLHFVAPRRQASK